MTTTALVPHIENLPALVGSVDSYIQTANRMPMLSTEEEQELAQRLRLQNDGASGIWEFPRDFRWRECCRNDYAPSV